MQSPIIIAVLVLIVVVALVSAFLLQRRRTRGLRRRFGPEYDHAIDGGGGRRRVEAGLEDREKRVESLSIRPLTDHDREAYEASWREVQSNFIEDPRAAVTRADQLLTDIMATRGYAAGNYQTRSDDVSVNHPLEMEDYRTAHEIATAGAEKRGSTEDLRRAMVLFRKMFHALVDSPTPAAS